MKFRGKTFWGCALIVAMAFTLSAQTNISTEEEQKAAQAASKAVREKIRKDPYYRLSLQGLSEECLKEFTEAGRKHLILTAVKWISTARGEDTPQNWDLATTPIQHLRVSPMTNAYIFEGSITSTNVTHYFVTWCEKVLQYKDQEGIAYLMDISNRVALAKQRPKISQKEALKIATKGFEAAGLDPSIMHLGKPETMRFQQPHPTIMTKDLDMPGYVVTWRDDAEGFVQATVSGVSNQIVQWHVRSKYIPRETGRWYYEKLGVTNIPPANVGPSAF